MNLITRCPNCGTAFRIQPAQLAARGGRVRCGKCSAVFDAVAALQDHGAAPASLERSPQLGLFDPSRRQARTSPDVTIELDMTAVEPTATRPLGRPVVPPVRSLPPETSKPGPAPEFMEDKPPRSRLRLLWGFLALLALLGFAGQLVLSFRTEVALLLPQLRPYLVGACRVYGCIVRLPRRPELMSIESSDLQADTGHGNLIVLNAVIRNRAPFAQEYPDLELTLTDENDLVVVRRVLVPADYVSVARGPGALNRIGPGAEVVVRLHFDTSRVRATGYRLYLFFP
ncbi:MAG: DUF3426 domain-containing protein [Burkholderiales bacterium]